MNHAVWLVVLNSIWLCSSWLPLSTFSQSSNLGYLLTFDVLSQDALSVRIYIILQRKVADFECILVGKCSKTKRFAGDFARKSGTSCLILRCNNKDSL